MGVLKGLKAIDKAVEDRGGTKAKWLSLKANQKVKVRVVTELDPDSPLYDESRGVALVASEHVHPKEWKRRALCTIEDEGRCVGCETMKSHPKTGWGTKMKAYLTVIVTDGKEDPYVAVWAMGVSKDIRWVTLRDWAIDHGSVSNVEWTVKRTGSTKDDTNYIMSPVEDVVPFDWSKFEYPNLEEVAVRNVPYSEQLNHFFGVEQGEAGPAEDEGETTDANQAWN